ncbi:uncharacterized protein JCM10292_005994 [Rhodotorula paludigena]|uniref:uncharacterized protein n=1 Tax=Rhodotorula paludigena TaxID=86838 RepID=UPI00317981C8
MSSATDSGTPAPNIAPATQIIPSIGLDGKPTTPAAPSIDNGGDHFPTGAAVMVAIVAAIAAVFIGYKLYSWAHRRWRAPDDADEPPELETRGLKSPISPSFATLPSQMSLAYNGRSMSGFDMGRGRQESWGGDSWAASEKGEFSPPFAGSPNPPGSPRDGSPGSANGSRASLNAFPTSGSRASFSGTMMGMPRRSFYSSSASGSQLLHTRAASTFSVSSPGLAGSATVRDFPSGNRISGAPHNPHSRIEVIPPSPLAPPPGTVIATDKSTLDFAPSSGIGLGGASTNDEWFAATQVAQAGDVEERLNPAFDGSYAPQQLQQGGYYTHPQHDPYHQQHSFPPSTPSSSSSSRRTSSSVPRSAAAALGSQPSKPRSHPQLRAQAQQSQHPVGPPRSASASTSANSSDSNLSSGSVASFAPPVPSASAPHPPHPHPQHAARAPPSLKVRTSSLAGPANVIVASPVQEEEPKSPLEKLQMRAEREARGLSLDSLGRDEHEQSR